MRQKLLFLFGHMALHFPEVKQLRRFFHFGDEDSIKFVSKSFNFLLVSFEKFIAIVLIPSLVSLKLLLPKWLELWDLISFSIFKCKFFIFVSTEHILEITFLSFQLLLLVQDATLFSFIVLSSFLVLDLFLQQLVQTNWIWVYEYFRGFRSLMTC